MDTMYQLWPWAVFGSITLFVWAGFSFFTNRTNRSMERLNELRDPKLRKKGEESGSAKGMFQKAAPTLAKALKPKTELEQDKLKTRLANAGFSSPNASQIFLSVKFVSFMVISVGMIVFSFLKWGTGQNFWLASVFAMCGGLFLPDLVLGIIKKGRQEAIFLAMPDALDLLVVCVESGLGLDAAMRRVSEEMKDSAPEVSGEIATCNMQLQMGRPRREVLHDLGVRTGVDDMRSLAAILIQADKFGSSIAQALRVQSDSMRVKRRQMAEEKAQQTAVKLIFPLVLFIFPGIFVVLVGPAAIQIMENLLKTQ